MWRPEGIGGCGVCGVEGFEDKFGQRDVEGAPKVVRMFSRRRLAKTVLSGIKP